MISHLTEFDAAFRRRESAKKRILLFEEGRSMPSVLSSTWTADRFELVTARTVPEAVMKLCLEPVDLVVLDLDGPGRSRWGAVREIIEVNPLLPVIILADPLTREDLDVISGASVILEKPVNLGLLHGALEKLLQEPFERRMHRVQVQRPILFPADAI